MAKQFSEREWAFWLRKLESFRDQCGHTHVPAKWAGDPPLATWVWSIRSHLAELPLNRLEQLERFGFDFGPFNRFWVARFVDLISYKRQHGHCRVPSGPGGNSSLFTWLKGQRRLRARMPVQRRKLLDQLGIDWTPRESVWNRRYAELCAFKQQFGHCRVPEADLIYCERPHGRRKVRSGPGTNLSLFTWLKRQRRLRARLPVQRRKLLDQLGIEWTPRESVWDRRYAELCAFKQQFGHCRVPQRWPANRPLARWVLNVRSQHGRLGSNRQRLLDRIGFDWDPFAKVFEKQFRELLDFKRQYGHCNVPHLWKANPALGFWVRRLRNDRDVLRAEWKKRLDQLGFVWAARLERSQRIWDQYFKQLAEFQKLHGHCHVPVRYPPNFSLGRWVTAQRSAQDSLAPACKRRLDALGFDWTRRQSSPAQEWEEWFDALAAFKRRFGHCNVPYRWDENPRLGRWVTNQRYDLKSLTRSQRKLKLDSLDFDWDPKATEWDRRFAELQEFQKRFGHCNVSPTSPDYADLGRWVSYLRSQAVLRPEQKDRLNRLGFEWHPGRGWQPYMKRPGPRPGAAPTPRQ
jgi:hypothetical protein